MSEGTGYNQLASRVSSARGMWHMAPSRIGQIVALDSKSAKRMTEAFKRSRQPKKQRDCKLHIVTGRIDPAQLNKLQALWEPR